MSGKIHIAVIGAGLMGHGIAQVFAANGHQVGLFDLAEDLLSRAIANIESNLLAMSERGVFPAENIDTVLKRIKPSTILEEAVESAGLVVEAVVENLPIKQNLFKDLDTVCPASTILATNTSVISITEIACMAKNRARILGTHFWNPPYLIPLVEVIRGQETDPEVVNKAVDLLTAVGKHPVRVKKDVPGFVANRLQHALWREAISIVEGGIADAATVDECVKYGFGLRLPVLGPLENADLVGTDLTLSIHDYLLGHLENKPAPSSFLKDLVSNGDLGFKTGRGFQVWTEEEMVTVRKRLIHHLIDSVKPMDSK
ncbi:MAG: 3-hydroxyacyl-CoA dehydrogenase family protein [Deltaproteobacteria bacterium]|nr:3-hydroxyacyl-CoA dehydrogenase family protein [Deltaproteobacteria bacterium]